MNHLSRTIIKNAVVAATIGLAAFASWAFTDFRAPAIEIVAVSSHQG